MAKQVIDTTTLQPNGKQGEPIRTAFEKANANFTELYEGQDALSTGKAAIGGGASQRFKVAASAAADEAVRQDQAFGVDQAIQGGLSRDFGITYTNSTAKPIVIQVKATTTAVNGTLRALVNTLVVQAAESAVATRDIGVSFVVPPGGAYVVTSTGTGVPTWREYR